MTIHIDRAFARLDEGLVHYRYVARTEDAIPLLLLHPSPSSSRAMEPLLRGIAQRHYPGRLIAPDTLGNGDSAAPAADTPEVTYFADSLGRLLDALAIERINLYGAHTGARIATEFAVQHPQRIGRLVLDGIVDYPAELKAQILSNYAPEVEPDEFGRQMVWAFNFVRDQALHFPYFLRDAEHRLNVPMPSPEELHLKAIDVLKALRTYHKPYLAAFRYPAQERFPQVNCRALMLRAATDPVPLQLAAEKMVGLLPDGRLATVQGLDSKVDAIVDFLSEG